MKTFYFRFCIFPYFLFLSADPHSLQYLYTGITPGIHFPQFTAVGLFDGEQFVYYDSNIRKMIPKTEWIQKITADDPYYWNTELQKNLHDQEIFIFYLQGFNQTEGVHTLQRMYGCEINDDGTTRGYDQYAYDGEDFISLDLNTGTWTAVNDEAEIFINKWDSIKAEDKYRKNDLQTECISWIKKFMSYSRETVERKVPPTVSVFQKHSSSPDVVCHATGFFPKALMISWLKDGEDVYEDVEIRETLPNQDGSFQKRSVLKVSAEDLQKHTYTCVIQHSSLEKEMVLEVPKGPDGGIDRGLITYLVGPVSALVGLVVLVVLAAGTVVWKKWRKQIDSHTFHLNHPVNVNKTRELEMDFRKSENNIYSPVRINATPCGQSEQLQVASYKDNRTETLSSSSYEQIQSFTSNAENL